MNPWENGDLKQLYDIGQTTGGRNPVQESQYQDLLRKNGLASNATPGSYLTDSTLNAAKQAQQFQVQANQPAIQTLSTQKNDLSSKYDDLLKSITASQQPAMDAQTLATNNELGRRGITSDSGIGQQQLAGALAPVATQFAQLKANTGLSQQQDLGNLAAQIAQLQAGNAPGALSFGNNIANMQQQAQQIAQNYALQQKQANYIPLGYGGIYDANSGQVIGSDRPTSIGAGGLYDPNTGQVIQGVKAGATNLNNNGGGYGGF